MKEILQDVNAVVGVSGSFVCDEEGKVLATALSSIFDETLLSSAGRTIAQTIAGLELTRRRKVDDLDLVYQEGRLIIKNLRVGYLCILCVPTINVPLLNLTANVVAKKLTERIKGGRPGLRDQPIARPMPTISEPTINGTFFSELERELTRLMGPIAGLVLKEHIAALGAEQEHFPRNKGQQLVEVLAAEIDDEGKRIRFQNMAREMLSKIA